MKNTKLKSSMKIISFFLCISLYSSALGAPSPKESVLDTMEKMITLLNDQTLNVENKLELRKEKMHEILKERFDEIGLARRALGKHWKEISRPQKIEFTSLFSKLLKNIYYNKIDSYITNSGSLKKENIIYETEQIKGKNAILKTKFIVSEEKVVNVKYLLKNKQNTWLINDISIEGVSIIKNYRSQFYELIENESFDILLEKIKSKL